MMIPMKLMGRAVCLLGISFQLVATASADNITNYVSADVDAYGIRTFTWVHGKTGSLTTQVIGSEEVTFGNGQVFVGVWISNSDPDGERNVLSSLVANGVQVLAEDDHLLSDDASGFAPSSRFFYGSFNDGEVTQVTDFYYDIPSNVKDSVIYNSNLSDYSLAMIQDVTVPYASYANCFIRWSLHSDFSYNEPNFYGWDAKLGVTLPTSSETGARALSRFMILAPDFGVIASGDVDDATGELGDMYVLTNWVPEPASLVLMAMGGLVLLCRRRAI